MESRLAFVTGRRLRGRVAVRKLSGDRCPGAGGRAGAQGHRREEQGRSKMLQAAGMPRHAAPCRNPILHILALSLLKGVP